MAPSPSDIQLIERVNSGEKEAFTLLIERYQQKVFQTCMGFMHNQTDAEDLAQEVFIKVYKSLKSFQGNSSFGTWIYRITVNKAINQLRRNKLRTLVGLDARAMETPADHNKADGPLLQREQKEQIKRALNQLNSQQKAAFVLFYYQELSMVEVAGVLQKSQKATESLVFRARQNLQKMLRNDKI